MAKKTEIKKEKIEREYIISIRNKIKHVPKYRRASKAIKIVKEFLAQHMKVYDRDLEKIKIDKYLNEYLWSRGIKNPPHKIKVKVTKEGELIRVELVQLPKNFSDKKTREEKREKKALESTEKKKPVVEEKKEEKTEEEIKEEKEKKAAVVESGKEMEKLAHKEMKHQAKDDFKQPKHLHRKALAK